MQNPAELGKNTIELAEKAADCVSSVEGRSNAKAAKTPLTPPAASADNGAG